MPRRQRLLHVRLRSRADPHARRRRRRPLRPNLSRRRRRNPPAAHHAVSRFARLVLFAHHRAAWPSPASSTSTKSNGSAARANPNISPSFANYFAPIAHGLPVLDRRYFAAGPDERGTFSPQFFREMKINKDKFRARPRDLRRIGPQRATLSRRIRPRNRASLSGANRRRFPLSRGRRFSERSACARARNAQHLRPTSTCSPSPATRAPRSAPHSSLAKN